MGTDERSARFSMRLGFKLHEWRSVLIYVTQCVWSDRVYAQKPMAIMYV